MSHNSLFQQGTMQLLSEGLLDGSITLKELLSHGNTGIGTGEGIDGELIIIDGVGYKINHYGETEILNDSFNITFADTHFDHYQLLTDVHDVDLTTCLNDIKQLISGNNLFFSVKLHGNFKQITTRSAKKSVKPYPNLEKVGENQVEFTAKNVTGTLISYYSPMLYQGVTVAGFHSHFLADNLSIGGHVLAAEIDHVIAYTQIFRSFLQSNPIDNSDFIHADLSDINKLDTVIKQVE
ncbi:MULTISPECIES: acetolactate decarboxylase [Enterococcaceae]|uniref:acetolactate decarboxylase n=1 Tax=Enterococcaceae TaxID=81852 RepID=UPI000E48DA3B|nr:MULTISPECIES: acetolactate decarboxylase [Enterococcaceae]RGI32035.1 acetolactate decarboxylase [Melissococcus sp. OM08-11BH]UNM89738.1 acetolactate decarboxylase [Vagococcus sp. CY52-2]